MVVLALMVFFVKEYVVARGTENGFTRRGDVMMKFEKKLYSIVLAVAMLFALVLGKNLLRAQH